MFDKSKIKEIVSATLIADSYSLGAHWIYDEKHLKTLNINWEDLNDACSIWHKGKKAGEFTHYGDQVYWLYKFCENETTFNEELYLHHWIEKMSVYDGYIDSSSKQTMENFKEGKLPVGSSSTDLSIVGRIPSLLLVSSNKHEFLENVQKFVKLTHNSADCINAANFFAKVLLRAFDEVDYEKIFLELKDEASSDIQRFIEKAVASKNCDTFKTIREFGSACATNDGFSGIIYLLCKYKNLKELLIENAKAGGDSSARAMVAAMIFSAKHKVNSIPESWTHIKVNL